MRYFRIHDDISDPEGDLYRWDGNVLRMKWSSSDGYSDHVDFPVGDQTIEDLMAELAGPQGRYEEVECPEK